MGKPISKEIKVTINIEEIYPKICSRDCQFMTFSTNNINCSLFNNVPLTGCLRCKSCIELFDM